MLPAKLMCPAAGQGALAIEIRKDDAGVRGHVVFLDDEAARRTTTCERALLNQMGGGCQVPIGALAEVVNGRLYLEAVVARPDGTKVLRESGEGNDPVKLGETVGEALLSSGRRRNPARSLRKSGSDTTATVRRSACVDAGDSPALTESLLQGNEIDLKIKEGATPGGRPGAGWPGSPSGECALFRTARPGRRSSGDSIY